MDIRLQALRSRQLGTQPQDAAKLCYQSIFGCSHILQHPEQAHVVLLNEMSDCPVIEGDGIEPISENMIRLHLGGTVARAAGVESIWHAMQQTAAEEPGNAEALEESLRRVTEWTRRDLLAFSEAEWIAFCESWCDHSFPPLSHSQTYHNLYDPHYRVLSRTALQALTDRLNAEH